MSCATTPIDLSDEADDYNYLKEIEDSKYSGAVFAGDKPKADEKKKEQFEFYPGTGEFIDVKAASKLPKTASSKGEYSLNFEGNELAAVVKLILGDILGENYVIAPGISGQVNFATVKPISKKQILPILEMLLSWNNAALVMIEDRYHVMPITQAIKGNLLPSYGHMNQRNGYTVMVVPLKYIAPAEMEKVLAPYTKEGAIVKADNARNLIFLSGTKRELSMYMDTINIFDVDWLEGMSTGIFTLNRVEADTIVGELEAIFGEGADNPLAGMFRFMPLERLNAIMVITPQETYLHKAKEWILRLDRADSEASSNLYVYDVENIKADDLAGYLNDVFGGGGGSSSSKKSDAGKVAPGLNGKEIGSTASTSKSINKKKSNSSGSSSNKDGVSFTAIEENNQILISANSQEYDSIMAAISRLDKEPQQVYIEAKVIEVKLVDGVSSGVEWLFGSAVENRSTAGRNGFAGIRSTESATMGRGGLTYVLSGLNAQANVDLSESSTVAKVLSSPSIYVLNNKEATINVGDSIAVRNTSTSINQSFNSTTYLQTGVSLKVKPRINPGGLVYIELTQEVSSPGAADEFGQRDISKRELTTEVAVQSGQTIIMGGLIKEEESKESFGVPGLHRIPIVGGIFGRKSNNRTRTETMVLLTPIVIDNPTQAKRLTKDYASQFKGLKPFKIKKTKQNESKNNNE